MTIITMAYRTQSGSVFFSLDGVPFLVSDKFKPPPKVTLPLKFERGNPSDVLFMEYDCRVEEEVIQRCAAHHEAQLAELSRRELSDTSTACADGTQDEQDSPSSLAVQEPNTTTNSVTSSSQTGVPYQQINGSSILVPTPITSAHGSDGREGTRSSAPRNFDIKDFETEQDPFENLSLRVMNDREELNKVFHATSPPQRSVTKTDGPPAGGKMPPEPKGQTNDPFQSYGAGTANGIAIGSSQLGWITCQAAAPRWSATNPEAVTGLGGSGFPSTVSTGNSLVTESVRTTPHQDLMTSSASFTSNGGWPAPSRQPLPTYSTLLRSAKSTPDIPSLVDECVTTGHRRTPPPPSHFDRSPLWNADDAGQVQSSYHRMPEVTERVENVVPGPSSSAASVGGGASFGSLPPGARHFIDTVTAMGFEEADVIRTVGRLGIDDKLVVDHLCQLGLLKEKGYTSSDAAMALVLFDNSIEKAETFLRLAKSFSELGFQRERIKDALVQSNLDEEKSLDLLVGS